MYHFSNYSLIHSKSHDSLQNVGGLQQPRYQSLMLPEPVYDYVYTGRQPIPMPFRDVQSYVNQIQEEIEKFKEEYEVHFDK